MSTIPKGQDVEAAREYAGFCEAEKKSSCEETAVALNYFNVSDLVQLQVDLSESLPKPCESIKIPNVRIHPDTVVG